MCVFADGCLFMAIKRRTVIVESRRGSASQLSCRERPPTRSKPTKASIKRRRSKRSVLIIALSDCLWCKLASSVLDCIIFNLHNALDESLLELVRGVIRTFSYLEATKLFYIKYGLRCIWRIVRFRKKHGELPFNTLAEIYERMHFCDVLKHRGRLVVKVQSFVKITVKSQKPKQLKIWGLTSMIYTKWMRKLLLKLFSCDQSALLETITLVFNQKIT